jgi:cytochrome oxidase Cu insertion factor (SCO1/SenC/PrrC family)
MSGAILGFLALALVAQAGLVWVRLMREVRVGERRPLVLVAILAGIGLALLAFARGPGHAGGIAAGLALAGGGLFLLLQVLGRQSRRIPAVAVGRPILDFSAPDADGRPFALAGLRGRPYLLKFFRGHW